ncbi:ATP-binding protein [Magnetospirillum fulvum]|uniref:histidine kinase n=1 Tax=Magnetospirillum fulvum TaxID=1082 RepID=A0A1H6H2Q8_MAGFU|nr:ATP-binding protein [Magnetospirillum fulvum]SEH29969.1 PAS domain S-box-containing protein [Magnetospirillum fulvum]
MSLRGFLSRLIWICILPLVLVSVYLAIDQLRQYEERRDLEATYLIHNIASTIDRMIGSQVGALKMLAASPLVEDPARWSDLYKEAQAFRNSFGSHVVMADADQKMVFSTRVPFGSPLPKLPVVKGHSAARTALETGKPAVGDLFLGPINGERLVGIGVPVPTSGPRASVIVAVVEAKRLQARLDDIALPADWSTTLLDGNGTVIASRTSGLSPDSPRRTYSLASSVSPWSVSLEVPQGLISTPNRLVAANFTGMILAAILAGLFGGLVASRKLTRSLASLTAPSAPVPTPGAAATIDEIEAVRDRLTAVAAARESALFGQSVSNQRFQRLFELAPVALCVFDRNGALLDTNSRFEQMFGYRRDEVATLEEWWRRAHPDLEYRTKVIADWPALVSRTAEAQSNAAPAEYRVTSRDGTELSVLIAAAMLRDDCLVSFVDITERKIIDAELEDYRHHLETLVTARTADLEAAEARVRLILESTADGLYGIDPEGRITFLNPSAGSMLGYAPGQLQGRFAHDLLKRGEGDGEAAPGTPPSIRDTLRTGRICRVEDAAFRHADGHTVHVSYSSHPMVRAGMIVGAVVSFTDISRRKATEAAREAALAEAERLARVRREFLANMSHEIRTPLTAVLGLARIGAKEPDRRKCQDYFDAILDSGTGLQGIVDDILDFSKIESGKMQIESVPIDLGEVIDRSIRTVAMRAFAKGLRLEVEEAAGLPAECLGDSKRLYQVLLNLLSNAVKFTPAGGSVTLSIAAETGSLTIAVADSGIGMAPETVDRLFQPFEQADGSTTRQFGGTGLGLAITNHLVEMMGGTIAVETAPERGSRFEIRLPLTGATPPGPTPPGILALFGLRDAETARLCAAFDDCRVLSSLDTLPADAALIVIDAAILADPANRPAIGAALTGRRRLVGVTIPGQNDIPSEWRDSMARIERPLRPRHLRAELAAAQKSGLSVVFTPPHARLSGLSILAAEDNEVNRLVLEDIVLSEGATLLIVENGRLALDALQQRGLAGFDAVLTDIQMPEMDGYNLAAAIVALTPTLPVIGLTAHAMEEEHQRCLESGMVEHVVKPIDPDVLVAAILRHARPRTTAGLTRPAPGEFDTIPQKESL